MISIERQEARLLVCKVVMTDPKASYCMHLAEAGVGHPCSQLCLKQAPQPEHTQSTGAHWHRSSWLSLQSVFAEAYPGAAPAGAAMSWHHMMLLCCFHVWKREVAAVQCGCCPMFLLLQLPSLLSAFAKLLHPPPQAQHGA